MFAVFQGRLECEERHLARLLVEQKGALDILNQKWPAAKISNLHQQVVLDVITLHEITQSL